ncbi:hypothetical protein [Vibrio sp. ABG19]|uniref:hypothetical protein n=1 Tax=Vibrio sp. ABG19 TaxID=2817385 RepID=UPI00249DBDF2|nr:hypothetical protein [Vibrio sp. ABG19]WGY47393.1 hypothetical protein J0X00_06885 [Vibrio sp. ABG19]
MKVKIQINENGEHYLVIPNELQIKQPLTEGDFVEWAYNCDGSWILRKLSKLEALKLKAFEDPEVKAEYETLDETSTDEQREFGSSD